MKRSLPKSRKATSQPKALPTDSFGEVVAMIQESKQRTLRTINTELIDLYWRVGELNGNSIFKPPYGNTGPAGNLSGISKRHCLSEPS
jgi:hypothetical protein